MTKPEMTEAEPIQPNPRRSATRNILTVMSGTLASRLLGLLRQTLFNRLFTTEVTDAFNIAYRVPNLFRELLAEGALTSSIIPVYKSLPAAERKAYTSSLTGALAAVNALIVGLGILLAPFVIGLRVSEGGSVNLELTVTLTRIVWPFLAGISFSALAMALLNAEERFAATSFSPLAFSLVSIVGFLLFPGNAVALAWITTLGGFVQFLVQIPSLRRFGLMPDFRFFWHPALRRTFALMIPFSFTTGTREFLTIVLTTLLSGFPKGAVTGFSNADQIFLMALGLFAVSPALAAYPRLAENAASADWDTFRQTTAGYARLVLFLTVPVGALLFALAPSVVTALYDWGRNGLALEKYTYTLLALPPLALAVIPWGLNQFLVRTLYVQQRTREAIAINVGGFLVNTAGYFLLAKAGFVAMNYATTATGFLISGVYLYVLHRQIQLNYKKLIGHAIKVSAAALVAALLAHLISRLLPGGVDGRGALLGILRLAVAGGVGLGVYVALCLVFQVQEVSGLMRRLRR
jgi:putative peptidoglycan lipid II flippase